MLKTVTDASVSRFWIRAAEPRGNLTQLQIAGPDSGLHGQRDRGQKMNIDVPDAFAIQGVTLDEVQDFVAVRHDGRRQILQQFEDRVAFAQTATGLLSMPRLNSASSCTRLSICGLTRSAQMSLSLNGAFCPTILPLFQGSREVEACEVRMMGLHRFGGTARPPARRRRRRRRISIFDIFGYHRSD